MVNNLYFCFHLRTIAILWFVLDTPVPPAPNAIIELQRIV